MKTTLVAVLGLFGATTAFCAEQFDAASWRNVQVYDIAALQKIQGTLIRKIVGVRISYRSNRIRHREPNWYETSVWGRRPAENKPKFVRAMVAKKDLAAFKAIPSDFRAPAEITVYGEVLRDPEAHFLFIRLFGQKATIDAAGHATVDW